jgi:hypothetical protein
MGLIRFAIPGTREPRYHSLDSGLLGWTDDLLHKIHGERIEADIRRLPAPRNRLHSPEAMAQAETIVKQAFDESGWQVERRPFSFTNARAYQDYGETLEDYMRVVVHPHLEGANILAIKEGAVSQEAILVIGHFDTVRDTPGANDNSASVAAMFELSRILAPYRFRRTIILAATDMEEIDLFGAKALAGELRKERSVCGVINYETMGYTASEPGTQFLPPGIELLFPEQVQRMRQREFRGDFTAVIYNGTATELAASFAAGLVYLAGPHAPILLRDPNDLPLIGSLLGRMVPAVRNFARGDHMPFWMQRIPGLFVNDTANFRYRYYHTPEDTAEKLDYGRLAAIVGATAASLAQVAGLEG